MPQSARRDADVIVVGAGSVGLLIALLLARSGLGVIVLEKRLERSVRSRAIGVSSPSLEILDGLGLASGLLSRGVTVRGAVISDGRREIGRLDFSRVDSPHPYVLAVPQSVTEAWLEENAVKEGGLSLRKGVELLSFEEEEDGARVRGRDLEGGGFSLAAPVVVACDGSKSPLREAAGILFHGHRYGDSFLMGDYADSTGWGDLARLFFTSRGSVESFPLPGGIRRWVLSTPEPMQACEGDWLALEAGRRSGHALDPATRVWESAFGVERRLARPWFRGRLFLAGDAAHLMSPIVGQNMNTGFADAEFLAASLATLLARSALPSLAELGSLGLRYGSLRSRAARSAATRAWAMMRLGTARGRLLSALRSPAVGAALRLPSSRSIAGVFTMSSIPGATLSRLGPRGVA